MLRTKIAMSMVIILSLLVIASVLYLIFFKEKVVVLDDTNYEVPNARLVELIEIYEYLIGYDSETYIEYTYLEASEQIKAVVNLSDSEKSKEMYISIDKENNQIQVKTSENEISGNSYNPYSTIALTVYNMDLNTLCPEIIKELEYYSSKGFEEGELNYYEYNKESDINKQKVVD